MKGCFGCLTTLAVGVLILAFAPYVIAIALICMAFAGLIKFIIDAIGAG